MIEEDLETEWMLAHRVLTEFQRIISGKKREYLTIKHLRIDKYNKIHGTCKIAVWGRGSKAYHVRLWATYLPDIPAIEIFTIDFGPNRILLIDLNDPRSLVRANLRERIKEAIRIYGERSKRQYT